MRKLFAAIIVATITCAGVVTAQQTSIPAPIPTTPQASGKLQVTPDGIATPNQEKARALAETTYNTWRLSVQRGDETAWRNSTSSARQMKVRNLIISERGTFPRDFFRSARQAPQLENFRFVGALSGCAGRTMAATYLGKMQLGDDVAKQNAFVLEFVHENGKWRLDQTRFFDLSKLPGVLKRLEGRDLSVLREQDGFHPYRSIPTVPPACANPELIGEVFVDCPGREIEIRINGVSVHNFDDERRADTISGGLRRGTNTIAYSIKPSSNEQDHPGMAIGVFVMPETAGNRPVCVFDHVLDAEDEAKGGNFTFAVTNEQIASMNPQYKGEQPQPMHAVPLKPKKNNKR